MLAKCSSTTFALLMYMFTSTSLILVDAVPISRLSPEASPASSYDSLSLSSSSPPRSEAQPLLLVSPSSFIYPSVGRAQIRQLRRHRQQHQHRRRQGRTQTSPLSISAPKTSETIADATWYLLHSQLLKQQQQQQEREQHPQLLLHSQMYTPQLSMSSFSPSKASSSLTQQRPPSPGQQPTGSMVWSDRTLEGHAVLDDDDDDAGNELFDTEADDLFRPDDVDEIEGTIEGEAMIEDDVFETDEDSDNNDDNEEEEEEEEEGVMGNEWLNMMRYGSESSSSNSYRSSVAVESTLWRGMMHHLSSVMGLMHRLGVPCQGHQQ